MTTPSVALKHLLPECALAPSLAEISVTGVTLDSREVNSGYVFLAMQGTREHGIRYLDQVLQAGAVAVLVEQADDLPAALPENAVVIDALSAKASEIAARFYGLPGQELHTIGVTGTNGKTTCTQLLARLYHALGERAAVMGTMGYGLIGKPLRDTGMTTPDAVSFQRILRDLRNQHARHLAVEISSHALAQNRVAAVPVQTAVFTNLTRDHLDFHQTMEAYGAAKRALFSQLGIKRGIINIDDTFGREMSSALPGLTVITYGLAPDAQVRASEIRYETRGLQARVDTPWGAGELRSQLVGEFNLHNLLAVVATACAEGYSLQEVLAAVPTLRPVCGRMELLGADQSVQVVVDYAHTPDALRALLAAARAHCAGKLWCVFGCGGDRDKGKRADMARIAEAMADQCVVTSDNPRTENPELIIQDVMAGFNEPDRVIQQVDRKAAIATAVAQAQAGDWVLVAGKGHEDYQIIGTRKLPFSDQEEARKALALRVGGAA
ncbi:UDP-N-acetylmuramoyl-L-alanyl-D-glutamate--2,6-diaminopimelate ligase [Simiduia agarivorans]|uniref:UDP-N-acetylmuramoyl-L-alanyl-D-glutamate--2,6-diaminopimelate ligase n=1 Tax=Simiduia agarivorans (strain DSM 21679 / JCM 13881 / BCRC 17597 / SA1) TaxID=1117647 RepID=K4KR14_SIMAS|nr:UDP-N-acetylmuramoyl-L-alanyl-D-glutamate--2,6-diaminopimelate ligase [Simiduia agarivorans]AFV00686.1 UDP-N-acetylmuramoylalanyl-D-glutamate--2, 6-diaminopimelate ligase [Simiduia agarivorans SA1 = DSM 21679]